MAKRIAGNVRAEIARTRINQQQIADALGQNQQYVSRRVVGRVAWRVDELAVIARMLGVEPGDLFEVPAPRAEHTGGYLAPVLRLAAAA